MRSLRSKVKDLPEAVTSAVVVESAARFRDDPVVQLLDPQSAINQLLSHGISFYRLFHSFTCVLFRSGSCGTHKIITNKHKQKSGRDL